MLKSALQLLISMLPSNILIFAVKVTFKFMNGSSCSSLLLLHSKKQMIIIEDKIEQKLQIGRWQLNGWSMLPRMMRQAVRSRQEGEQ